MILKSFKDIISVVANAATGGAYGQAVNTYHNRDSINVNPVAAASMALGGNPSAKNRGNIAERAGESIAYYPVIASTGIGSEAINVFVKHHERNIAEMIKIILSSDDVIQAGSKQDVINSFRGSVFGGDNAAIGSDGKIRAKPNNAFGKKFMREDAQIYITMIEQSSGCMRNAMVPITEGLNESYLPDYMRQEVNSLIAEAVGAGTPAPNNKGKARRAALDRLNKSIESTMQKTISSELRKIKPKKQNGSTDPSSSIKGEKYQYKANEMAPTIVEVEVYYQTPNGTLTSTTILFAIKAVLHPVSSSDLSKEVGEIITTNRAGFSMIQVFTGEIQFWRDFVFNAQEAKRQNADKKSAATSMFTALQRHARHNDMSEILDGTKVVPTSTLVMTVDEVEAIKSETAENVMSSATAAKLVAKSNLMGLYIMDEAVDAMYAFNVNSNAFDKYSIPKEKSKNQSDSQVFKALAAAMKN